MNNSNEFDNLSQEEINYPRNSTIQRCPHDRENPYAQLSRALIRDKKISPECRLLLSYLLSNKDGWTILPAQIQKEFSDWWGRDKVYKLLNEAIEAGYIKRVQDREVNRFAARTYYLSESPKFKKCFPNPEIQDAELSDAEKPEHKKEYRSNTNTNLKEEKKEQYKERSELVRTSADASYLTTLFIAKLKEAHPRIKPPNIEKWAREMDRMLKRDERDVEEVKRIIEWFQNDNWFKANILSMSSLRNSFDRINAKMLLEVEEEKTRKNKAKAYSLKDQYPQETKGLLISSKFVTHSASGREIPFNLPESTFEEVLLQMVGAKYVE